MMRDSSDTPVPSSRSATPGRWKPSVFAGILAGLVFLAVWTRVHEERPHLPTSDLYTHLTVARHLAQGEGFLTDVTYPLSFAFPFARELPQPLIHRQPGFSVLLTLPYFAGGGDPDRTLDQVRVMQLALLGLIIALGAFFFFRQGNRSALPAWLVILFFNPLLVFAIDWGMVELACSLILLALWLRARGRSPGWPDWVDGLLAGMLTMLRLDLVWVPILWWILQGKKPTAGTVPYRRLGLVLLAWLLLTAPWAIRNVRLTGNPVFSLQSYAEHVKDTRSWPGYTVYRQLDTQAMRRTMADDPVPVLRKVGRGLKFYFRHLPRLAPMGLLLVLAGSSLAYLWRESRRKIHKAGPQTEIRYGPPALASLTTILLVVQYSFFDHSLRHLLVVLPVMVWEFSHWVSGLLVQNSGGGQRRFHLPQTPWAPWLFTLALALAVTFSFPCRLPGWESAAADAVATAPQTADAIELNRRSTAQILFVSRSAIPWYIDRPVVWNPIDDITRDRIRELLPAKATPRKVNP